MYMLILLSHALAFSVLFVASVFDLKTTEVPDSVSVVGVSGGIFLHFLSSLKSGFNLSTLLDLSILINEPLNWFQALGDPLLWSLGVGAAFSIFGWSLYFLGLWGGADAFGMSVLGFAAPTSVKGFSMLYSLNVFTNILLAGFLYTLIFALIASRGSGALRKTYSKLKENEKRVSGEVVLAGLISSIGGFTGAFNPLTYFLVFLSLIFLYRYLRLIQDDLMVEEVPVSELEGGEVLADSDMDDRKVRGITEEEIEQLEKKKVEVQEGVRFVPVFPLALLITDIFGGGIYFMYFLFS